LNSAPSKPLLHVLSGGKSETLPIWLMRQAGRYLPEYRALRAEKGGFLALVNDSDAAADVTLQPIRRFGFAIQKALSPKSHPLWKTLGKGLAEGSGQTQGQDSSTVRGKSSTASRTREKIHSRIVDSGDGPRESAGKRGRARVKLLAKFVGGNKPRSSAVYQHQQSLL